MGMIKNVKKPIYPSKLFWVFFIIMFDKLFYLKFFKNNYSKILLFLENYFLNIYIYIYYIKIYHLKKIILTYF